MWEKYTGSSFDRKVSYSNIARQRMCLETEFFFIFCFSIKFAIAVGTRNMFTIYFVCLVTRLHDFSSPLSKDNIQKKLDGRCIICGGLAEHLSSYDCSGATRIERYCVEKQFSRS